jgi:virginiamycin B lyase
MAPDGSVWAAEQASNKLARWDPQTKKFTEYKDKYLPGKEDLQSGGQKHTVRFDPDGNVWTSGTPLTRFDIKTKEYTRFEKDALSSYGTAGPDKNGNIWFTQPGSDMIGMADYKTLQIKKWSTPTKKGRPRRINVGPDDAVWFAEYNVGKIGRFDPRTETFKEYELPGLDPSPYGFGFDAEGYAWYSSFSQDTFGRLDPKTGKVVEYPFPHVENTIRELYLDSQGRVWYGTPANNKVGYLYLAGKPTTSSALTGKK